jgi:hypothetical protein
MSPNIYQMTVLLTEYRDHLIHFNTALRKTISSYKLYQPINYPTELSNYVRSADTIFKAYIQNMETFQDSDCRMITECYRNIHRSLDHTVILYISLAGKLQDYLVNCTKNPSSTNPLSETQSHLNALRQTHGVLRPTESVRSIISELFRSSQTSGMFLEKEMREREGSVNEINQKHQKICTNIRKIQQVLKDNLKPESYTALIEEPSRPLKKEDLKTEDDFCDINPESILDEIIAKKELPDDNFFTLLDGKELSDTLIEKLIKLQKRCYQKGYMLVKNRKENTFEACNKKLKEVLSKHRVDFSEQEKEEEKLIKHVSSNK